MTAAILGVLAVLLFLGVPIFIGLAGTVLIVLGLSTDVPLLVLPQRMFGGIDSFTLTAIPFFNLAAEILRAGKLSDRLTDFARVLVGFLPGGLGMAAVLACMLFASVSGSSPATVIAAGTLLIPALVNAGYGRPFAVGLVTTAGSLGILIPPSITFIIYGVVTGTSIGALFLAGILPGFLTGGLLMVYCLLYARRNGIRSDPPPSGAAIKAAVRRAASVLGLPVLVLGGIYGGVFTPTEAAAVSVFYALFLAMVVHRSLTLRDLPPLLSRSALVSGAILLIVAGASSFSWLITSQQIPQQLSQALLSVTQERWLILVFFNLILLVLGCFLESSSAIIILAPLMMSIAPQIDLDPVHLGAITVMNMEIGMLTPPVGLNLMVAKVMTGMPLMQIIRATLPFTLVILIGLIAVTYVPWFSLVLPQMLYG